MNQFSKDMELTYQLSLDHFLAEQQEFSFDSFDDYQIALNHLEDMKKVRSTSKRYQIASDVLTRCPHCVEALLAVSLYTSSLEERLQALLQASTQAMMKLGQDYFSKDMQDYYLDQETHLFFRCKTAYALALFDAGFLRTSKTHFEIIRRLNPSDTFHVLHYLLCIYLVLEDKESGYAILQNMATQDAFTCYSKALYAYKDMEFQEAKNWLIKGKAMDESIYQLLTNEVLPNCDHQNTSAAYFLMIYEKALRGWKEFASFVRAI